MDRRTAVGMLIPCSCGGVVCIWLRRIVRSCFMHTRMLSVSVEHASWFVVPPACRGNKASGGMAHSG